MSTAMGSWLCLTGVLVGALAPTVSPGALDAQTTKLRGKVVRLNGQPAADVRIRIEGHGEPAIFDSGEFEYDLSGSPAEVRITVIDSPLRVVFPPGGQVAVPGDPSVRVPVVVDQSVEEAIQKLFVDRSLQLEITLQGTVYAIDSTFTNLEVGIRDAIVKLGITEDTLRSRIRAERRADLGPRILRTVDTWLLALEDLQIEVRLFRSKAGGNSPRLQRIVLAVGQLQEALRDYDRAVQEMITQEDAFLHGVQDYWRGDQAGAIRDAIAAVYGLGIDTIHAEHVLALNEPLVDAQSGAGGDQARFLEAAGRLEEIGTTIAGSMDELRARVEALRSAMLDPQANGVNP